MRLFNALISATLLVFCAHTAAQAQVPNSGIPSFMPKGAWSVQPSMGGQAQGMGGIQLPCMMMTEYDNGYVLRLSGGAGKFLAMSLDVRQKVFTQGRKYNASLSLNNGFNKTLQATAFSDSVLIFNVRSLPSLYGAMMNASNMTLDIEGNNFGFGLGSIQAGVSELESCFGGGAPPMPMTAGMPSNGLPMTGSVPAPAAVGTMPSKPASNFPQWGTKISKAPDLPMQNRSTVNRAPSVMASATGMNAAVPSPASSPNARSAMGMGQKSSWKAKAGDDMRATLQRWASTAGVALDWQAGMSGKVAQDINVSGSFGEAVQTLMAQNSAVSGLDASLRGGSGAGAMAPMALSPPMPMTPISSSSNALRMPPAMSGVAAPSKFQASAGTSLEDALGRWARKEGVEFVWQANQGFGVKRTVQSNGGFTDALQEILSQYQSDSVRPMAQLNNDPVTGKRTLFVQSTRI